MLSRSRTVAVPPEDVWRILADGWLHPLWLVGSTAMRAVDESFPQVGAQLHHSTGTWPITLSERTTVLECEPGRRLVLSVRGRLLGEAHITVALQPDGEGTEVQLGRELVGGLRMLVPPPVRKPVLDAWADECLVRLSFLAERRP